MSNQSAEIKNLAASLSKAQAEIVGAVKDSANLFFKSSYADLGSVMDAIRVPLTKNGLAYTQTTDIRDGKLVLVTTLLHSSGQWISGVYPIKPVKDDPQGMGSATTYARRYALAAMCGVAQVDDDGEAAMDRPKFPSGKTAPLVRPEQPGPLDGDPNAKHEFQFRFGDYIRKGLKQAEREAGGLPALLDWHDETMKKIEERHKMGKLADDKYKIAREDLSVTLQYINRREGEMEKDSA